MSDFQELAPKLPLSPSFAELDRQEADAIAGVQLRRPGILAVVKSLIGQLHTHPVTGLDTLQEGRIRCAPRDRKGSELSERVTTSALQTDPTLPLDLRLVQRVRKKQMIKSFSLKTRTEQSP